MASYKFDDFQAVVTNPVIIKHGHSGGVFENNTLIAYYADVTLKGDGVVDSITTRLESDEMPNFAKYPDLIEAIDVWISQRMAEHLI